MFNQPSPPAPEPAIVEVPFPEVPFKQPEPLKQPENPFKEPEPPKRELRVVTPAKAMLRIADKENQMLLSNSE